MIRFLNKLSNFINAIVEKICMLLLAIISILTVTGVISRYVIGTPIIWLYEVTLVLFSWVTFLGVSIAFKKKENIGLDFLINHVPKKSVKFIQVIILISVILFFIIGIKDSGEIIKSTLPQKYDTVNISTAWFYLSFPVGAVISIIHLLSELSNLNVESN